MAARVRFNFTPADDVGQKFAGLSKTIRNVGQQVSRLDQLAQEEADTQEKFQNDLDSIFGLVGKNLTEEDYKFLVQEKNAEAQNLGVIRSYENFSLLNAIDEERAKIRLTAYSEEMKKMVPAMSNPTEPLSIEDAENQAFAALDNQELGVDSVGNPVFLDLDTQRTGEMIAFSRGLSANNFALKTAVDDNRHQLAVEGAGNQYQIKINDLMTQLINNPGSADVLAPTFTDTATEYFGYGVEGINGKTLEAVESFAVNQAANAPITPDLEAKINQSLDVLVNSITIRPGAGTFGAEGTENNNKINLIRDKVGREIALRERQETAARSMRDTAVENELKKFVLDKILEEVNRDLALGDGKDSTSDIRIRETFKTELSVELLQEASRLGHTDPDKVLGNFDSILGNITLDSHERYLGHSLHNINFNADSVEELGRQEQEAYDLFTKGFISIQDYKTISSEVEAKIKDFTDTETSLLGVARREGGFGSSQVRSQIRTSAEDILKMNDKKVNIGTQFNPTYVTMHSEDNDQLTTNQLKVEEDWINNREAALKGGNIPALGIREFNDDEIQRLKDLGVDLATIGSLGTLFVDIPLDTPGEDSLLIRRNISKVNQRALSYSQYLAMQRLIEYSSKNEEARSEASGKSFSGDKGVIK